MFLRLLSYFKNIDLDFGLSWYNVNNTSGLIYKFQIIGAKTSGACLRPTLHCGEIRASLASRMGGHDFVNHQRRSGAVGARQDKEQKPHNKIKGNPPLQ